MSYTIKRTNGTVAYVAKHATSAREAVKAAVKDGADFYGANLTEADLSWANLTGANFYGANFYGANFYGANLTGANVAGADLARAELFGAEGIVHVGPVDRWDMYAVRWPDGPRIKAGCRWFTVGEAREWWEKGGGTGNTPEHGPLMLAGVEELLTLARAHEWEMPPGQEVAS